MFSALGGLAIFALSNSRNKYLESVEWDYATHQYENKYREYRN